MFLKKGVLPSVASSAGFYASHQCIGCGIFTLSYPPPIFCKCLIFSILLSVLMFGTILINVFIFYTRSFISLFLQCVGPESSYLRSLDWKEIFFKWWPAGQSQLLFYIFHWTDLDPGNLAPQNLKLLKAKFEVDISRAFEMEMI